jgi:hypothetical protein
MGVCQDSRLCAEVEMNKIMELADEYANYSHDDLGFPQLPKSSRAALASAIQAEQDYTRAVISERDAWKESAEEQVMLLNQIANERDGLRKAAQMAMEALRSGIGGNTQEKRFAAMEALRKELENKA